MVVLPRGVRGVIVRATVELLAWHREQDAIEFTALCRIDTRIEMEYYRNGGILQTVIRKKLNESRQPVH